MEAMIDRIKKFGRWIIQAAIWLLKRRMVCIALLLLVAAIFSIWYILMPDKTSADRFRFTGLVLELCGIFTVAYGLYETLKLFKRTLRSIISELFKGFPKFEVHSQNLAPSLFVNSNRFPPHYITTSLPLNSSIENRVAFLEEHFKQIHLQAHENRIHFENELTKLSGAIKAERIEREGGDKQAQQALKKFAVDGLAIEMMGGLLPCIRSHFRHCFNRTGTAYFMVY